jgi:hypothetical protein
MAAKPTKQQVAQAKARAGGNNPVKVTNAGLKKLGSAALIAASFTPVGRVAKGVTMAAKATKVAKAAGKYTPAQKASLAKATATAKKTAAKVEKRAMKNIDKPVPKSSKPAGKITGVKSSGFKKPKPQTNKWSDGGNAKRNAETAARTKDTMRPLTSMEKMWDTGKDLGGVKVKKASEYTAANLAKARTQQGTAREVAAAKKAEEIRKAKATQRMLDIKNGKK